VCVVFVKTNHFPTYFTVISVRLLPFIVKVNQFLSFLGQLTK